MLNNFISYYRRFSTSFSKLRVEHRQIRGTRKQAPLAAFEDELFAWPSKDPEKSCLTAADQVRGEEQVQGDDLVQQDDQDNAAGGTGDGLPNFTTCGRLTGKYLELVIFYSSFVTVTVSFITGTFSFDDFEAELIAARPRSIEEELEACKKQLKIVMKDLQVANIRIQGLFYGSLDII